MRRVVTFWRLDASERSFIIEALAKLWACRLALWLMPLSRARRLLATGSRQGKVAFLDIDTVAWSVERASRYIPCATCLVQALAAQAMLSRRGVSTEVHIGVSRGVEDNFEAHAWLGLDGRIVLGHPEEDRYTPLVALAAGEL
jgi:hypothetical protein